MSLALWTSLLSLSFHFSDLGMSLLLAVSPFFLCPISLFPFLSVSISLYLPPPNSPVLPLIASPPGHVSPSWSPSPYLLPFLTTPQGLAEQPSPGFPPSQQHGGQEVEAAVPGCPLPRPPSQHSLLPRSQQPLSPPSDKTYLLPQGRPELA